MPYQVDLKYDKRIIERNLRSGLLSEKEYKKHLQELRDLAADISPIEAEIRHIGHDLPNAPQTDEDEL